MKWVEFAVYTTDVGLDIVCGALSRVGIDQVSLEESAQRVERQLKEAARYWDFADFAALAGERGPCVKAYIADLPEQRSLLFAAREAIEALGQMEWQFDIGPLRVEETTMDDEDWANAWKRYYKPIPIGSRLLICPSWEEASLSEDARRGRVLLKLDPGMVFGTGAHHTTRMCLEIIEEQIQNGASLLDLGSGSGILSIAALLLGASSAICVDIDPVARQVIDENMGRNGCVAYQVEIGDILEDAALQRHIASGIAGGYDMVVANIVADVVIALCWLVPQYLKRGGCFLCSGVIEERAEEVERALGQAGFIIRDKKRSADDECSGWLAYLCQRG